MTRGGKLALGITLGTAVLFALNGAWLGCVLFVVAGLAVLEEEFPRG